MNPRAPSARPSRGLTPAQHAGVAVSWLLQWRKEAQRRARSLEAAAVWALVDDPRVRAVVQQLDDGGSLLSHVRRVCAEVVAAMPRRHPGGGIPPSGGRCRRRLRA